MVFIIRSTVASIVIGLVASHSLTAQNGCEKLDTEKPSAFISFEKDTRESINGRFRELVLLKLTNNTSCKIEVATNGDGIDGVVGNIQDRSDNVSQIVFYDTRKSDKSAWKPANYFEFRDLVFHRTVSPGASVIFPVERNHTKKPYRVSVRYKFEWEESSFENTDHRTFYWFEMQKGYEKLRGKTN